MIDESTMYWITRLDKVSSVLSGLAVACGIVGGIMTIVAVIMCPMAASDGDFTPAARMTKRGSLITMPLFLIFLLGWAFVPTTKEYAAIKLIPAIVNNQKVQTEASDVYELLKDWLKDQVQAELPPEKGKSR